MVEVVVFCSCSRYGQTDVGGVVPTTRDIKSDSVFKDNVACVSIRIGA